MAILFAGTEPEAFASTGTVNINSSARDSTYSRVASIPVATGYLDAPFGPRSAIWCSFAYYQVTNGVTAGRAMVVLKDTAGVDRVRLVAATSSTRDFQYWDGSAWQTLYSLTVMGSTLFRITLSAKIGTVDGYVKVYVDEALVGQFQGNTNVSASALFELARFQSQNTATSTYSAYSEVIIADEDTVSMRLKTLTPTADGAYTDWSGNFTDIDETGVSDADLIMSNTVGQKETYVWDDLPVNSLIVAAVVMSTRAQRGASGPQNMNALVRNGGVDGTAPFPSLDETYGPVQAIMHQNPITGAAWLKADVNSAEFGLQSVA